MKLNRLLLFYFLLSQVASHGQTALTTVAIVSGTKIRPDSAFGRQCLGMGDQPIWRTRLGNQYLVMSPTRISSRHQHVSISAGSLHSLAVQSNGTVWAWGMNNDGRLGNGNFNTASNPVAVTRITNAIMVAAGGNHSLACACRWAGHGVGCKPRRTTWNRQHDFHQPACASGQVLRMRSPWPLAQTFRWP